MSSNVFFVFEIVHFSLERRNIACPIFILILMGDWCSEELTDTKTQRNLGNGTDSANHGGGLADLNSARNKSIFSLPWGNFSLDRGPFNG